MHYELKTRGVLLWLRIGVTLVVLTAVTLSFLVDDGWVRSAGEWLNSLQIVPLGIACAVGWLALWVVVTILFGRVYCSTICPLGTLQDVIAAILRVNPGRGKCYRWAPARNGLRYPLLGIMATCVVTGLYMAPELVDPYTAYNRMAQCLAVPAWEGLKALFGVEGARWATGALFGALLAAATVIILAVMVRASGRIYCNTLCPVGASLSLLSIRPVWHMDIDTDLCTNCRRCEYVCKAQCVNLDDHTVDASRCLMCLNCTASCPTGAMRYTTRRHRLATPLMQQIKGLAPRGGQVATDIQRPKTSVKYKV